MSDRMTIDQFHHKLNGKFSRYLKHTNSRRELEIVLALYIDSIRNLLPLFYTDNFITHPVTCFHNESKVGCINAYIYNGKCFKHSLTSTRTKLLIGPHDCVGHTWLYRNDFQSLKPDKLAKTLIFDATNPYPCVIVPKIGNHYLATDGNHRIYASYLLGNKLPITLKNELIYCETPEN